MYPGCGSPVPVKSYPGHSRETVAQQRTKVGEIAVGSFRLVTVDQPLDRTEGIKNKMRVQLRTDITELEIKLFTGGFLPPGPAALTQQDEKENDGAQSGRLECAEQEMEQLCRIPRRVDLEGIAGNIMPLGAKPQLQSIFPRWQILKKDNIIVKVIGFPAGIDSAITDQLVFEGLTLIDLRTDHEDQRVLPGWKLQTALSQAAQVGDYGRVGFPKPGLLFAGKEMTKIL